MARLAHPEVTPLTSSRELRETAPRLFEAAMHYSSSISRGMFDGIVDRDAAAGIPVRVVPGRKVPRFARRGLHALARGEFTVLQAEGRTRTLRCEQPPHSGVDTYATLDSAVAGDRWFVTSRLVWRYRDFADVDAARVHDRIIVAAESDPNAEVALCRLTYDDVEGAAIRQAVRDLLLRELVLLPAFDDHVQADRVHTSLPRSGEDRVGPDP